MAEEDMEDWPFGFDELKPHYQSLLDWMPVASIVDGVDDCFSIELKGSGKPMMSSQAHKLQEYWGAASNELARRGYAYGASKLAIDAGGCERCGLCLYGCPKHLIYDSSSTLDELMRNERFTYRKSWIVSKVDEESNDVRVWAKNKDTGERRSFVGDRVFLAAGVVSTTRIVMSSLGMFRTKVKMLHSDHFQFPLISHCPTSNVREENLHTLAQMFLLRKDEDQKWLNMQLYTYNDFYSKLLDKKLRNFPMMITSKLKGYLENRLLVIKGYLHSDTSSHMLFSLASEDAPIQVEGARNKEATVMARSTMLSLFKDRRHLGMTPLLPMFKMGIPGQGNHSGGSFPMMSTPVEGGSNRLGVPVGLRRTHIVDATAFSSIPSTTITFTAMANARRIVHEVLA
jgi:hypothetical protein